jgi:signal transduction histidine kinase
VCNEKNSSCNLEAAKQGSSRNLEELLRVCHDVTKLINSELELPKLIDTILALVCKVMEVESAFILHLDETSHRFKKISSRGEWSFNPSLFDTIKQDHIAHCLVKHKSFIKPRDLIPIEVYDIFDPADKETLAETYCAPLEAKGKITGLICIRALNREFDLIELEVFCSLASQAAIAMENAALHERLRSKLTLTKEELEVTQAQLIRSEKISSLVEMAMGVAHSIRNPVMSIGGLARRLNRDLGDLPEAREKLDYIIEGADRLENIVKEFEKFSKKEDLSFRVTDIVPIIRQALEKSKEKQTAAEVRFDFILSEESLPCWIDPVLFRKVLDEILSNSMEVVSPEGSVVVRLEREGHFARIDIADSGIGIPPAIQTKIFDPFFSTKIHSIGLGLTYVHRIIKEHQGTIEVKSDEGHGTTFVIRVPVRKRLPE